MLKKAKQFVAEMQAQAEQNRERVAQFEKERLEAERAELMNMSEKELLVEIMLTLRSMSNTVNSMQEDIDTLKNDISSLTLQQYLK